MDNEKELELTKMLDGLQALIDEADARGSVPPFPGARDLTAALRQHLAGDPLPVRRFLGLVRVAPGRPGIDKPFQLELLREYERLRTSGLSHEAAAEGVGVDQTTISAWKNVEIGWTAEVLARLETADGTGPKKVTGANDSD